MKKNLIKRVLGLVVIGSLLIGTVACGNSSNTGDDDKKSITVGVSPGPYNELFDKAVKPILEKQGYEIKSVDFSDLLQSEVAITEGSVDFNVAQHTAYAENYNKEKGGDLTPIVHIPTVPAGIYSNTHSTLDDVKDGSKVAIPNDPSNAARAFRLLEKAGWIKLDETANATTLKISDIKENLKGIDIIEMDSSQIPRALNDLDYAIIPGSVVYSSKIDSDKSLLSEDVSKDLELVVVVSEKYKDSKWAKAIVDAYKSDEFKEYMKENNKNNYWFIPDELK
ncbi:MAG: MetQ/NlpA family ABC transporter substrate-binding protein [Clostridiaceae bacterium]|nr:MetQ/NlpA family ABC transporter substrate-binding protein [Clostridiaceae bacterium]